MRVGDQRVAAVRARPGARQAPALTGFEWFILGLIVAMVADVALFVWIVAHEFAR